MEVVRVGGGLDDGIAGGEETENNHDAEIQDRKLVCMVRHRPLHSSRAAPGQTGRPGTSTSHPP